MKSPKVITIKLSGVITPNREELRRQVEKGLSYFIDNDKLPQLQFDDYGKPYLLDNSNLVFSYAHSKTMLTLIVCASVFAVGIDTENINRLDEIIEISDQAFSKEELDTIKHKDMLFSWCLKEAAVKQLGKGFRDADPSAFTIMTEGDSYKLYLSGKALVNGYFKKKYVGDDLIVVSSNLLLENLVFSTIEQYIDTTNREIANDR